MATESRSWSFGCNWAWRWCALFYFAAFVCLCFACWMFFGGRAKAEDGTDRGWCELGSIRYGQAFVHNGQPYVRIRPDGPGVDNGDSDPSGSSTVVPTVLRLGGDWKPEPLGRRTWVRKCELRIERAREAWEK